MANNGLAVAVSPSQQRSSLLPIWHAHCEHRSRRAMHEAAAAKGGCTPSISTAPRGKSSRGQTRKEYLSDQSGVGGGKESCGSRGAAAVQLVLWSYQGGGEMTHQHLVSRRSVLKQPTYCGLPYCWRSLAGYLRRLVSQHALGTNNSPV